MQRRVREHNAKLIVVWRDLREFDATRREYNRPFGGRQHRFRIAIQLDNTARDRGILHHQRKRFLFAKFAQAKRRNGVHVPTIAREVIAAESLHRQNLSVAQKSSGSMDASFASGNNLIAKSQRIARTASWTCDRLRVKTPVRGVVIFRIAFSAERPCPQRSVRPVVGQTLNYGETRAAHGAINVRIVISPVRRIEKFPEALSADGQVRQNANCGPIAACAFANGEITEASGLAQLHFDRGNSRGGRRRLFQPINELTKAAFGALQENLDALFTVQDPSEKRIGARQSVNERTKTRALDGTANFDGPRARHRRLISWQNAAAPLPANLRNLSVLHENRHRALSICERANPLACFTVVVDIELDEFSAAEFQPLAHFLRVRAAPSAVKLKLGHERKPPARRASRGKSKPGFPGCAECNRNEPRAENPPSRVA